MESTLGKTTKLLVAVNIRMDASSCKTFAPWIVLPPILKVESHVGDSLLLRQGDNSNFHFDGADYG